MLQAWGNRHETSAFRSTPWINRVLQPAPLPLSSNGTNPPPVADSGSMPVRPAVATGTHSNSPNKAATFLRKRHPALWNCICKLLEHHESPDQGAGRLELAWLISLSFWWLCQRIDRDRAQGDSLYVYLSSAAVPAAPLRGDPEGRRARRRLCAGPAPVLPGPDPCAHLRQRLGVRPLSADRLGTRLPHPVGGFPLRLPLGWHRPATRRPGPLISPHIDGQ